jgi:hypothetical protein
VPTHVVVVGRDATDWALHVGFGDPHLFYIVTSLLLEPSKLATVWTPQGASAIDLRHLVAVVWGRESHVPTEQCGALRAQVLDLHVELECGGEVVLELLAHPPFLAHPQHSPSGVRARHAVGHDWHRGCLLSRV